MASSPKFTIAVVGAGVFGVTAALELRKRGHRVSLFDPGPLPHPHASSTDISKVLRLDYGSDEFYMRTMEAAFQGWHDWNARWDRHIFHQTGFLALARAPMVPGGFEYHSYHLARQRGHPLQRLDSAQLKARFPAWDAAQYPDGYFNPHAGWAASGQVVSALLREAQAAGVALHEGVSFQNLLQSDSRVTGILTTTGQPHLADYVVIAAGAWTPLLLPHLADLLRPTAHPILLFRPPEPSKYRPPHFLVWAADIANTGWYGFPAQDDGTLKIAHHGAGWRLDPNAPRTLPPGVEDSFRAFLRSSLPGLADAPLVGSRLCFYCDTWDGDFWIDHDPQHPGLIIATGGSGHAFKFAPLLGSITANVLEGKPDPYAHRFAWRPLGRLSAEQARFTAAPPGE